MEEFVKGEKFDNFLNVDLTCTENESKCISDKLQILSSKRYMSFLVRLFCVYTLYLVPDHLS